MKSALDYIYESGCRNIDNAIAGVIDRLAPNIVIKLPSTMTTEEHADMLVNTFNCSGDRYIEWIESFNRK